MRTHAAQRRGRQRRGGRRPPRARRAAPAQPTAQQVETPEVVDLVGDAARFRRSEPRPFVLADQPLEGGPSLERHQGKGQGQRSENALHVTRRRLLQDEPAQVHEWKGEDVREEKRPPEKRGPSRHVRAEHDLRDDPAHRAQHEQPSLQVVGRVVEELELLDRGDQRRAQDRKKPLADVVRVPLRPSHPLTGKAREGADAFGRRLSPWRVDHLVSARVELECQLPVLGDAGAPTDVAQDVGANHVSRARDHLQRPDRVLEWTLDHVAAGILGAHRFGQPALRLVQHVPLVALHRRDLGPALDLSRLRWWIGSSECRLEAPARSAFADAVEQRHQTLDRVGERNRVGVEHDDVLGS